MYSAVLILHSWVRWAALFFGVLATVAALTDRGNSNAPGAADRWSLFFMMVLDIQMLLGLLLYLALSPYTLAALKDFGAAMHTPELRFWAVEHSSMMIVAVVLAHVGRVLTRTARTPQSKRTRRIVCFGLATILIVAGTPWPGTANARKLFRI